MKTDTQICLNCNLTNVLSYHFKCTPVQESFNFSALSDHFQWRDEEVAKVGKSGFLRPEPKKFEHGKAIKATSK